MNNCIKYALCVVLSSSLFSCFKDKGNYDYNIEDEVKVANMNSSHSIKVLETLTIDPKVKDSQNYRFVWSVFSVGNAYARIDTLSKEPILSKIITLPAGQYNLRLEIIDKVKGYSQSVMTSMYVTTETSNGWFVLKSNATTSDVDVFTPDGKVLANLIERVNGTPLQGNATSLAYFPRYSYYNEFNENKNRAAFGVTTDKDIATYGIDGFDLIYNRGQLFFGGADLSEIPMKMTYGGFNNLFYSDKKIYNVSKTVAKHANKFSLPIRFEEKEIVPLGGSMTAGQYNLFYDKNQDCFIACHSSGSVTKFKQEGADGKVDPSLPDVNALGSHPVYMASMGMAKNDYSQRGFILMKSNTTEDRFVYEMNSVNIKAGKDVNPILGVKKIAQELKINQATLFGHNYETNFIYYPVGNTIYLYDYSTNTESSMVEAVDGEVTMIKNIYWQKTNDLALAPFNYLLIATHKGGKYKISIYELLGGRPKGEAVKVLEGDGKAMGIYYVAPQIGAGDEDEQYYPFH